MFIFPATATSGSGSPSASASESASASIACALRLRDAEAGAGAIKEIEFAALAVRLEVRADDERVAVFRVVRAAEGVEPTGGSSAPSTICSAASSICLFSIRSKHYILSACFKASG